MAIVSNASSHSSVKTQPSIPKSNASSCITNLFRSLICCSNKGPKSNVQINETSLGTRIQVQELRPKCIDITPDVQEPWEQEVASISKEQIRQSMDQLLQYWHVDPFEEAQKKQDSKNHEEDAGNHLRELNKQIFLHMKRNHDVDTPVDFLLSLQGHVFWNPMPIMPRPQNFIPEEGQFYQLAPFDFCPFGKFKKEESPGEGSESFGCAFKRIGNELYLYLDGQTEEEYLLINGKKYSYAGINRGGNFCPSHCLKEGDVVCVNEMSNRFFIVGKNGSILFPADERQGYENEIDQTIQFNNGKTCINERELHYTTKKKFISEIVEPFEPGFVYYPGVSYKYEDESRAKVISASMVDNEDRTIIDIDNDPILQSLINYLGKEFEVMGYSDEEKMMRIAHLAADILSNKPVPYENHNYMLGEILRTGWGTCRHKAILTKILCNSLLPDMPCALVAGEMSKDVKIKIGHKGIHFRPLNGDEVGDGHAWIVMKVGGHNYIIDSMNKCLFAADNAPGIMLEFYGAERLVSQAKAATQNPS